MSNFSISGSDLLKLAHIVREETGNDIEEKNFPMLESRIRSHVLKLTYSSMDEYWNYFKQNEARERKNLCSLMTTHYTFFFREYAHFEVLSNWIQSEIGNLKNRFQNTKQPVRVWSAACSRGQEVYSLALYLEVHLFQAHGVPFEVIGTDIDHESVEYAKNGVYPIKEVNTIPSLYLNGYWKKGSGDIKEFAAVSEKIKVRTQFEVLNLFEISKFQTQINFDVVFCRNVFIYFSKENVNKIALEIAKKLSVNGLFVSGVSEPIRFKEWELASVGPSCYKKTDKVVLESPQPALGYQVLCVDDSPTIQTLMKKVFAQDPQCAGVEIAGNGQEARTKLDHKKFDLVTLDIHMPVMGGIEFLESLYRKKSDPPVLMVSSVNRTDIDLATKSLALGAFDYVEKPAMSHLEKSIDEILLKSKMAMRLKTQNHNLIENNFQLSISQKIVVPDASQCLRILVVSELNLDAAEHIIRNQSNEHRSPATLIICSETTSKEAIKHRLQSHCDRPLLQLNGPVAFLKANTNYIVEESNALNVLQKVDYRFVSLQVLCRTKIDFSKIKTSVIQVLLDESLTVYVNEFEKNSRLKVSDVTQSNSFTSLSLEFFAHLRKVSA
jgi:chemotaxis protein methyltransferase CheR